MSYINGIWQSAKGKKGGKVDTRDRAREVFQCVGRMKDGSRCPDKPIGSALYCKHHGDLRAQALRDSGSSMAIPTSTAVSSKGPDTWTSEKGWIPGTGTVAHPGAKLPRPDHLVCNHKALEPCLTLSSGKKLYGGQGMKIERAEHLDLILDCAGLVKNRLPFVISPNRKYRALNQAAWPEVVRLSWPDMTAPTHISLRFWQRLLEMLPNHTAVCCMGGHGRTGTALAALLVADGMDPERALVEVRAKHCVKAIETSEQENYIRSLGRQRGEQGQA